MFIMLSVDLLEQQNYDEIKSMIDKWHECWCGTRYRTRIHYIRRKIIQTDHE